MDQVDYLISTASGSDQWRKAQWGDTPSVNGFGLGKVPREWVDRLTSDEQETLDKISEKTDEMNFIELESWIKKNEAAYNTQLALQAKLLGANIDVEIPDDVLKEYAGKERREELPGQQSMFYGENVPVYSPETPVAKEEGIRYNVGGGEPRLAKALPAQFRQTFHAAKEAVAKEQPDKAWRVDSSYTDADYEGMDCYTSPGGSCVAVHDGDIVSVCGMPGDKVRGSDLLKHAVQMGGKKLDAFSGLYGFYAKNGFEPVSWCKFDEQYAPPDWVKGRDKPEPVIFWKYTGRTYQEITKDFGEKASDFTKRIAASENYDQAKTKRDHAMEG